MKPEIYNKKVSRIKKYSENFIKKANSHYHKLLKRDSNPQKDDDPDLLRLHTQDLADSLLISYLIRNENFVEANSVFHKLDTLPSDLFPTSLIDLLLELAELQEKSEKDGHETA